MIDITEELLKKLKAISEAEGLELFGVVPLGPEGDFNHFTKWLAAGRHAGMSFLERYLNCREDPRQLLVGAKTALVLGLNYYQGDSSRELGGKTGTEPSSPQIAQYARLKDYHKVLRRKGEAILSQLLKVMPPEEQHVGRVIVDSAPLLERALAAKTGSGFVGKNTCFIHPQKGSFFLLAEILLSIELPAQIVPPVDPAVRSERGGCGSCRRCQVYCPTGALDEAYSLDANKCLAYWTIEHRGTIPERFWPWLRHYVFGCDICQLVCPYNRKATTQVGDELLRLVRRPSLSSMALMSQAEYEAWFGGTPLTRAKREGLMRNALIAMAVTGDRSLEQVITTLEASDIPSVVQETMTQIRRGGYLDEKDA